MKVFVGVLITVLTLCMVASGQDAVRYGARGGLGVTSSYSPTSSHVLIGISEQRRTFTAGAEFTRRLWENDRARIDYSCEFSPLFRESDPTMVAEATTLAGSTVITPVAPTRVVRVNNAPIGSSCVSLCNSIYPVYGHDETTYAAALSPLGARAIWMPGRRIEPTFETSLGVVVSSRDIPVDGTTLFNYQFSFGPGVQVFASRLTALRVEYVFRHISNANSGTLNPGIDQGVFRLTLSRYR
jgi:hypothetical protein